MTSNNEDVNVIDGAPFTHVDEAPGIGDDVSIVKVSLLVMSWRGSLTSLIFLLIIQIVFIVISAGWIPGMAILLTNINTINKSHCFMHHLIAHRVF
ncbi:hypothetical protein [Raoultella terrigena]|uniref:hypothetical protein n=1 Tax=Raoultella terrigena TaxID=577 RepID=UPI00349FCAE2